MFCSAVNNAQNKVIWYISEYSCISGLLMRKMIMAITPAKMPMVTFTMNGWFTLFFKMRKAATTVMMYQHIKMNPPRYQVSAVNNRYELCTIQAYTGAR